MAATANRRKQDDRNLEILREIISINGNKYCLDCNQRGPTYVNTTIGSFVCSKCSGMLRGLTPPHRVKSISMATFTPDEIEYIRARGNDYCRRVWLGLYEGESVNFTDEQSVKDFMSDKYEKKRYYLEGSTNLVTNGNTSVKSKSKIKVGSSVPTASAPLISISPQSSKPPVNSGTGSKGLVPSSENNHRVARPVHTMPTPLLNHIAHTAPSQSAPQPVPASVPDFPVDFSTADIYNSSQYNNNVNNNFTSQPNTTSPTTNEFGSPPSNNTNDRYAALADLDLALRQQNLMKNMEETNTISSKNPFQSSATNDVFTNGNPFFNGWSPMPAPVPVNPFINTNNGGYMSSSSKNPFL